MIKQIKDKIRQIHLEYVNNMAPGVIRRNSKRLFDPWIYIQPSNRKKLLRELSSDGLELSKYTIKGVKYVRIHFPQDSDWDPSIQSTVYQNYILMSVVDTLNEKYGKTINIMHFGDWVDYD